MIILFGKRLKQLKDMSRTRDQLETAVMTRIYSKTDAETTEKILYGQQKLIEGMFYLLGL